MGKRIERFKRRKVKNNLIISTLLIAILCFIILIIGYKMYVI